MILEINKRYRNSYVKSSIYVLIVKMWRKYRWNWFEQFPGYFASLRRFTFSKCFQNFLNTAHFYVKRPSSFVWARGPVWKCCPVFAFLNRSIFHFGTLDFTSVTAHFWFDSFVSDVGCPRDLKSSNRKKYPITVITNILWEILSGFWARAENLEFSKILF